MLADQDAVPAATPDPPVELVHFTETTAILSLAVPLTAIDEAGVEVMVNPGVLICIEGAVVSPVPAKARVPVSELAQAESELDGAELALVLEAQPGAYVAAVERANPLNIVVGQPRRELVVGIHHRSRAVGVPQPERMSGLKQRHRVQVYVGSAAPRLVGI